MSGCTVLQLVIRICGLLTVQLNVRALLEILQVVRVALMSNSVVVCQASAVTLRICDSGLRSVVVLMVLLCTLTKVEEPVCGLKVLTNINRISMTDDA